MPVKNTFVHYGSPVRTIQRVSSPSTVPSSFAPKHTFLDRLRSPYRDSAQQRVFRDQAPQMPFRDPAHVTCTPIVEPKTPVGDMNLATPSTVGGCNQFAANNDPFAPFSFHMPISVAASTAVGIGHVQHGAMVTHQYHQCAVPPAMPQPQANMAAPGTLLRLSEFLPSPSIAHGAMQYAPMAQTAASAMVASAAASASVSMSMEASAAMSSQQAASGWMQGYEGSVGSMMPQVPPLPDPAHSIAAACGGACGGAAAFDTTAVVTAAAAAAAAVHFQDPAAAAAAAAAAATVATSNMAGGRLVYDPSGLQYYTLADTSAGYPSMGSAAAGYAAAVAAATSALEPPHTRVSISAAHFPALGPAAVPMPGAAGEAAAAAAQMAAAASQVPPQQHLQQQRQPLQVVHAQPQLQTPSPQVKIVQFGAASPPKRQIAASPQPSVDEEPQDEPQEEPAPSAEGGKKRGGASKPRRRRGGHGRGGAGNKESNAAS